MKNKISLLIPTIVLILFSSCGKDSVTTVTTPLTPTNQSVSGTAFYDINGNGLGEEPMIDAIVYLGDSILLSTEDFKRDSILNPDILATTIDMAGNYIFEGVNPRENQVLRICPIDAFSDLVGVDNNLDGDLNEALENELIQISIDVDETDDGNDFVAYKLPILQLPPLISGSVLEDTDGDLSGDLPISGRRLELYERAADGLPVGQELGWVISDESGYFEFNDIPSGEYVIYLLVSTSGFVDCGVSMDQTPEPGEPTNTQGCSYISVNLTNDITQDQDNVFVLLPRTPSISGNILEDIDQDLIGDLPAPGHRVELYERNAAGVPTSSTGLPIAWDNSDENGYYSFSDIPEGEYVIYHIGTGDYPYDCVANIDQSPEPGEPTMHAGCQFISVNLTAAVSEDEDNVFVISRIDPNLPGSLSGTIYEDITSDGQPDEVTDLVVMINIYERDNDGFITGSALYTMASNPDGSYEFPEIAPGNYAVSLSEASGSFSTIFGRGNGGPQPLPNVFPLTITSGSTVVDTYFWIFTFDNIPSINGQVDEDTNGDGLGDTPQFDHTVELYFRDNDDLPTGDLLYKTNTTSNGGFYFTNLTTNRYILVLTGPANYECASSGDESPEPGELNANQCRFILVNFVEGVLDEGNKFVVFEN